VVRIGLEAAALVWVVAAVIGARGHVAYRAEHGAGGFRITRWARSQTVQYLTQCELDCPLYSNEPYVIIASTPHVAYLSPRRTPYNSSQVIAEEELARLGQEVARRGHVYLAWFEQTELGHIMALPGVREAFRLRAVRRLKDGAVYEVLPYPPGQGPALTRADPPRER